MDSVFSRKTKAFAWAICVLFAVSLCLSTLFLVLSADHHDCHDEFRDEDTGKLYRACIIPDATACCQQGIEFVLKDDTNAEEDLVVGLPVAVQGNFDTYYESKIQYCTLRNAELV